MLNILFFNILSHEQEENFVHNLRVNYYKYLDFSSAYLKLQAESNLEKSVESIFEDLFAQKDYKDFDVALLDSQLKPLFYTNNFSGNIKFNKIANRYFDSLKSGDFVKKKNKQRYFFQNVKIRNSQFTIVIIKPIAKNLILLKHFQIKISIIFLIISLCLTWGLYKILNLVEFKQKAENELKKSNRMLETLIKKSKGLSIIGTDSNGTIILFSLAAEDLFGYSNEEIIGSHISSLVIDTPKQDLLGESILLFNNTEKELIGKNKRSIIAVLSIIPYYNIDNEIESFLILVNDKTTQKKNNEKLKIELTKVKAIAKISELLTVINEPAIILDRIINEGKKVINYDFGTFYLLENEKFIPYHTTDPSLEMSETKDVSSSKYSLLKKVLDSGNGIYINSLFYSDENSFAHNKNDKISHLAVPLILKEKNFGVLLVSKKNNQKFCDKDLSFMKLLAPQAAGVLDSAKMVKELKDSKQKYKSLIDESIVGIFILNQDTFAFVNKTFQQIIGLKHHLLIGNKVLDYVIKKDRNKCASLLSSVLLNEKLEAERIKFYSANGEILTVELVFSIIHWKGKLAIMGSALDITEKLILNEQLLHSQKLGSVGELTGGITHDFKNILHIIHNSIDKIISNSEDDSTINNLAKNIKISANHGSQLTKRLLGFSRQEIDDELIFNLNDTIEETISISQGTMNKNIVFNSNLCEEHLYFKGDTGKIQQCLLNLFVNSRDAMENGGTIIVVSQIIANNNLLPTKFDSKNDQLYCNISVSDNGTGIPKDTIDKIFKPFFTTKDKYKGTGIGLATTFRIINEFEGFIDVSSELGKGTIFNIYLPLNDAPIEISSVQESALEPINCRILIVDDEQAMLDIISELLEECGSDVVTVNDGVKALELLKSDSNFDLIIADRNMPNMDGLTLFKELCLYYPKIKVILSSGYPEDQTISSLREIGLFDYLEKPYDIAKLFEIIDRIKS